MTNEEIIEQLENTIGLIKQDGKDWLDDRDIPILEVCIKALTVVDKTRTELYKKSAELRSCENLYDFVKLTYGMAQELEQEPSGDLISRQAVKEQMIKYGFHAPDMTITEFIEDELSSVAIPPAEPETGHWIEMPIGFKCSNCNELEDKTTKFCPNCGFRMIEP